MNSITFSNSITDALGWTLLHAVWQGFALVLPVAIFLHVLRNQSSAWRYRVGVAGLLAQLLASVVTFAWLYKPVVTVGSAGTIPVGAPPMLLVWPTLPQTLPWPVQMQQFLAAHLSEFVLVYLTGVLVFALRLAGGWLYLQRLRRRATLPASDRIDALVQSLRTMMQIGLVVRVRESAQVAVPMVVGVLKPVLLLPIGLAANLSMDEVEAVLAHELAHVKRHDYAVNLLQSVVEVLYFFHPALWWLSARVREEREHCCDDLAVKTTGDDGRTLAKALAHVEELQQMRLTAPALAMALTSRRQLLLHRVRRVLGVPTRPHVSNGSLAGLTLATLLLLSVSVYAVQQPQPKPKPVRKTVTTVTHENTTFSITDKKIQYVVWKGQKLPASRVAQLQKLYDQVMAGQLNLDAVKQPDRDILLQLIEANYSSDKGTDGPNDGLNADLNTELNADLNAQASTRIDYNAIIKTALDAANSAGTFPVNVDDVLNEVKEIDYNRIIQGTTVHVDTTITGVGSVVTTTTTRTNTAGQDRQRAFYRQDSLLDQRGLNEEKITLLKAKAQIQEFAVEAVQRKTEQFERQKYMLERRRLFETNKQRQAISETGYSDTDSIRATLTKQIEAREAAIHKIESDIEGINQKLVETQSEMEKVEKPLRQTELDIRKLGYFGYQTIQGTVIGPDTPRPPKPPIPRVAPIKPLNGHVVPVKPTPPVKPAPPVNPVPKS